MDRPIILYILGLGALALVVGSLVRLVRLRKCRKIPGRIVDFIVERKHSSKGTTTSSFPIYEYEWQGEIHRYRSNSSSNKPICSEVELYIDADGVIYEKRSAVIMLLFGLGFLFIVGVQFLLQ